MRRAHCFREVISDPEGDGFAESKTCIVVPVVGGLVSIPSRGGYRAPGESVHIARDVR